MAKRSYSSVRSRESRVGPSVDGDPTLPFDLSPPAAESVRVLRLFVSAPAYAAYERNEIHQAVGEINEAAAGLFAVESVGLTPVRPSPADQPGNLSAADCDAVFAVMRGRLPSDPEPGPGAEADAGGGLAAVARGGGGGTLPDITIFRFSDPVTLQESDPDWENGKRAFAHWFEAKGGETLVFEDFDSPETFAAKLRTQLDAWLTRFDLPWPPAPEDPEGEAVAALAAEIVDLDVPANESARTEPGGGDPVAAQEAPPIRPAAAVDGPEAPAVLSTTRTRESVDARVKARKVWRGRNRALDIDKILKAHPPTAEAAAIPVPEAEPQAPVEEPQAATPEEVAPAPLEAETPAVVEQETAAEGPAYPRVPLPQAPPPELLPAEHSFYEEARGQSRVRTLGVPLATVAVLAGLLAWGLQWRSEAERTADAQRKLAAAADTASNLVFDLTGESWRLGGATNEASKEILDHAQRLQGELVTAGAFDATALKAKGEAAAAAADTLVKQGKTEDAVTKAVEAERAFQTLASAQPDRPEWQDGLADADTRVGDLSVARNDLAQALGAYRDAAGIRKALAQKGGAPNGGDDPESRRGVATAEQKVADVLVVAGRLDEGLATYRDALVIRKALVQADPSSPDRQRDVMETQSKIGDVLSGQNHFDDALAVYREAFFVSSRMAQKYPADTRWRGAETLTDNKIGDVQVGKGLIDDALATYREGLAIMKQLAAEDPSKTEWQSLIATCHERIGDAFAAEKHYDSALGAYHDALDAVQVLAAKEPKSSAWQRGVSETQLRIGSVLFSQGNVDGAIAAHKQSLDIVKALAAKEPDNPRWKRDLMMDNNDIGLLYASRDDRDDALPAYQAALTIARAMQEKEPANTDWRSNRAMIDSNMGALLMELGKRDEAVVMYRDGLANAKALVQQDPHSAEWQSDLVVALYNLGEAGEDSEANLSLALEILKRLDAAGVLQPDKKALMVKVQDDLARVRNDAQAPSDRRPAAVRSKRR